jgi:DNA-binding NtrC family response regulator
MTSAVLMVDEDRAIRKLCNDVLTGCGVDILLAGGACEAIEVSNQYRGSIDLLLSDTLRCGFTGDQLALILLRSRPAMRVLLMCSHGCDELNPEWHFITKPFRLEALASKVRECLLPRFSPASSGPFRITG